MFGRPSDSKGENEGGQGAPTRDCGAGDREHASSETSLNPAARRAKALGLIRRDGAISIQRLAEEIGVSRSTARRNVDYLSAEGHLEKSHGRAPLNVCSLVTFEPPSDDSD
jgi:hypothetical protein